MKFRLGFLGAWALFVIALGAVAVGVAAEAENLRDERRVARLEKIDALITERLSPRYEALKTVEEKRAGRVSELRSKVENAQVDLDDSADTDQTIIVSTAENRVVVRQSGKVVFQAVCSTGKGTTLIEDGRKMVFETPTGRFKIRSKEENPVWVPPDWHYVEEARKKGGDVVRLRPGEAVDSATGNPVATDASSGGIFGGLGKSKAKGKILTIENGTVVELRPDGTKQELPPGEVIRAGKNVVIPPVTAPQRRFGKVLGRYRLNLGGGYALHGTQAVDQLGRAVSHGCVRLADKDLEQLYAMTKVGDQVIIY
ncbi:MAG: L,D-transpeptidase [Acidobacteriota bacterium]|nr:L,D-transpeptidase [Acidobacteriota bacterium]